MQRGRFDYNFFRKYLWVAALFTFFSTNIAGSAIGAVWGDAGLGFYLFGSDIVAPNGLVYDPLMRLQMNLNVGSKNFYGFAYNSFFTEKPTPGVTTNSNQGRFDFTKREYDLVLGLAARPFSGHENLEFRLWTISLANLNRGTDPNKPNGFKDGMAAEVLYYLSGDRLWGNLGAGYFFSKQLVEPDGEPYKPGALLGADLNYDILNSPKKLYAFGNLQLVNLNSRWNAGLAWRPFDIKSPDTELRATYGRYINLKERTVSQSTFLVEVKYYFETVKGLNQYVR